MKKPEQSKDSFLATMDQMMIRFGRDDGVWSMHDTVKLEDNFGISCHVLCDSSVLVALRYSFSFYNQELKPITHIQLKDLVDGCLKRINQFSSIAHGDENEFTILTEIDAQKIECKNIEHIYTGKNSGWKSLMAALKVTTQGVIPQVELPSLEQRSLFLKDFEAYSWLELSKCKFLVSDLIIDAWQVVGKITNPDNIKMWRPVSLPNFGHRSQYVLVSEPYQSIVSLINI